jgi:4-hydroxy-3-methylbut-2-enyl diphosphate reductase
MVSQTTNSKDLWEEVIKKIMQNNAILFGDFNTICYTTNVRQKEARIVSSDSDVMLVLGNSKSANTNKLLDICRANCKQSFLIQTLDDMRAIDTVVLSSAKSIGITAGASTPRELIDQVVEYLK